MPLTPPHGMYFEDFVIGESAESSTRTITEADIVAFAGLSGDFNEIHVSEPFSAASPAGRRIAHGMLGLSIASGLAVQMGFMFRTVEFFRGVDWEFVAPIFIGDTLHIVAEVSEIKAFPRLKNGKVMFKVVLKNQTGVVTQRGTWTLLVKMRPA